MAVYVGMEVHGEQEHIVVRGHPCEWVARVVLTQNTHDEVDAVRAHELGVKAGL